MITATCHDKAAGTRTMYQQKGRRLATTLGDPDVADITRDMLSEYVRRRLSTEKGHGNAKAHTVAKELITVRRALREAHERGVLAVMPPMPRLSPGYRPREVWLTPEEFGKVAAKLPPDRALWASLAALGGLRAGEVTRLTWGMVAGDRIRVPGTKTATSRRTVPVAPALAAQLELARPDRAPPTTPVVAPWSNVRRDLRVACDAAKVKRVSPNDLRRTYASWLVQAGAPLLTVATLLGHSSTRMVEKVYGRLSETDLGDAVARLPTLRRLDGK